MVWTSDNILHLIYQTVAVLVGIAFIIRLIAYNLREQQYALLYYPRMPPSSRSEVDNPGKFGMYNYEEVRVQTDNIHLHGYVIKQHGNFFKTAPTIVYFHGNAGNVGHRMPIANALYKVVGANVVMVDYRGYGFSEGTPDETGLKRDAAGILQFVHSLEVDANKIVIMGSSLGGAVCIYLAAHYPHLMSAVIVENTFLSISDMVDSLLSPTLATTQWKPLTRRVVDKLFRYVLKPLVLLIGWRSSAVIPKVSHPICFLSGQKDELVPPAHMNMLYSKAKKSAGKTFVSFPNGTHNDTWFSEGYFESIANFINDTVLRNGDHQDAPSSPGVSYV